MCVITDLELVFNGFVEQCFILLRINYSSNLPSVIVGSYLQG